MSTECRVYRCSKQDEMYLYVREGLATETLPEALLRRTGRLTEVMKLKLDGQRKLARVDADKVAQQLAAQGFYLQMPPDGIVKANLHFGD